MNCSQCKDCAFARKSLANLETDNHLRGILTVCAGTPFYCHEQLDWKRAERTKRRFRSRRRPRCARGFCRSHFPGRRRDVCCQDGRKPSASSPPANWFRVRRRKAAALRVSAERADGLLASELENVGNRRPAERTASKARSIGDQKLSHECWSKTFEARRNRRPIGCCRMYERQQNLYGKCSHLADLLFCVDPNVLNGSWRCARFYITSGAKLRI
jgi:hypothetical protein